MVEHIVDRIHHARFRAAEAEWNVIRSGDDARDLTEADYRAVIEAWMDTGEVRRARVVFNSCPFVTEETRLLEWEILDAEESLFLRESVYPAGFTMHERWVLPSFIPNHDRIGRWAPGRIVNASDPTRPTIVWARPVRSCLSFDFQHIPEARGAKAFQAHRFDLKEGEIEEWEIVPPMKIVNDAFFIVVQTGSTTRMYPVVCDEAPWNTGRREAARRARMEDLKKWAEGK